jgi:HAD superfamily hydrolase (TIGR01484 family)
LIRKRDAPHVAREAWVLQSDATVVPAFGDAHLSRAIKIVGVCDEPARILDAEKAARDAFAEKASIARSQAYFLDVTDARANKGAVMDTISGLLNIAPDHIATIGDGANDVLMFRKSGFSIAMGNATPDVKAQASAITESNENDGFARAIRGLILQPAGNG